MLEENLSTKSGTPPISKKEISQGAALWGDILLSPKSLYASIFHRNRLMPTNVVTRKELRLSKVGAISLFGCKEMGGKLSPKDCAAYRMQDAGCRNAPGLKKQLRVVLEQSAICQGPPRLKARPRQIFNMKWYRRSTKEEEG